MFFKDEYTKEQAIAISETKFWRAMTDVEVARFQLFQKRLMVPMEIFQLATENALNRPVFTHEFGLNVEGLQKEFIDLHGDSSLGEFNE